MVFYTAEQAAEIIRHFGEDSSISEIGGGISCQTNQTNLSVVPVTYDVPLSLK